MVRRAKYYTGRDPAKLILHGYEADLRQVARLEKQGSEAAGGKDLALLRLRLQLVADLAAWIKERPDVRECRRMKELLTRVYFKRQCKPERLAIEADELPADTRKWDHRLINKMRELIQASGYPVETLGDKRDAETERTS